MKRIVVLEPLQVDKVGILEMARPLIEKGHEITIYKEKAKSEEEQIERVKDADILIIANSILSGKVIREAKNLEYIAVAFTGVDHVDLDTCKDMGVKVSNAAGYSTSSVAELTFGLIIDLYRNISILDESTRKEETKGTYRQRDLFGKKIGVIGTGAIGKHVINIALAFGMDVLAYNRSKDLDLINRGVEYVELEDLLKNSDIVTIHLPQTKETEKLISDKELSLMKKDSILINTARGPIVDNEALSEHLNNGTIAGAGIDVFDMEPPIPNSYSLIKAKNTILTPHIGFATEEAMLRRLEISISNIENYLKDNQINKII